MRTPASAKNVSVPAYARGFLPAKDPLQHLPSEYAVVEETARELPKLLVSNRLRVVLDGLRVPSPHRLKAVPERERIMMLLSFLCHAYVWGGESPATQLPKTLAVPWYDSAVLLGRPPVLSYASYALWKWRRLDRAGPVELGNIALLQNFLGGQDEEWFVLVHVEIERRAAAAVRQFRPAVEAAAAADAEALGEALEVVARSLRSVLETLDRMPERCDPYVYFNRVRPYIHGWKDSPALPEGLLYEGVGAFKGEPQQFRGETGAQSSILPALDAVLGVKHNNDPLKLYLMEMRQYMPSADRLFVESLEEGSTVRSFVERERKRAPELRERYNTCIELLSRFRLRHFEYAGRFIHQQSMKRLSNPKAVGTGGTPFMRYLKKHLDETERHLIG